MKKSKKLKSKETETMKPGWLYGWKDIADYVGCDLYTVKRYARKYCVPIRRLPNNKPFALRDEMDNWAKTMKKPYN